MVFNRLPGVSTGSPHSYMSQALGLPHTKPPSFLLNVQETRLGVVTFPTNTYGGCCLWWTALPCSLTDQSLCSVTSIPQEAHSHSFLPEGPACMRWTSWCQESSFLSPSYQSGLDKKDITEKFNRHSRIQKALFLSRASLKSGAHWNLPFFPFFTQKPTVFTFSEWLISTQFRGKVKHLTRVVFVNFIFSYLDLIMGR